MNAFMSKGDAFIAGSIRLKSENTALLVEVEAYGIVPKTAFTSVSPELSLKESKTGAVDGVGAIPVSGDVCDEVDVAPGVPVTGPWLDGM